jgi:NodT family efflux transporter outer membrane factor (OMF) lipoprotein
LSIKHILLFSFVLVFGGCALTQTNLEKEEYIKALQKQDIVDEFWWKEFGSQSLNKLVDIGLENSPNILIAIEKIEQARLQLNIADNSGLPTADIRASSSKSENKDKNSNKTRPESTSASLGISYEIDLWNRVKSSQKSSKASFDASKYDYEALRLSLISNIVTTYFQYQMLNEKVNIAEQNLEIATKVYNIVDTKYSNGIANGLDISRQKSILLNQELNLSNLQKQQSEVFNALAILVGLMPDELDLEFEAIDKINVLDLDQEIDSDILYNRPDIAIAYEQILQSEASIDLARAAKMPSFSLSASGGLSSATLLSLHNPASSLAMALSASYNLFDGGELENRVLIEKSKAKSSIFAYKNTLLNALKEVDDALNSVSISKDQNILSKEILDEAQNSFELSELQYRYGLNDLSTLLDVQKSYFNAKESYIQQRYSYLSNLVLLVKALGGGWQDKE